MEEEAIVAARLNTSQTVSQFDKHTLLAVREERK